MNKDHTEHTESLCIFQQQVAAFLMEYTPHHSNIFDIETFKAPQAFNYYLSIQIITLSTDLPGNFQTGKGVSLKVMWPGGTLAGRHVLILISFPACCMLS